LDKAASDLVSISDDDVFPLNLFQPSVSVLKDGDEFAAPGDEASYSITVANTGSEDSPPLVQGSITDTLLGDLIDGGNPYVLQTTCTDTLPTGDTCVIEAARAVQEDDPDPLPNTVFVSYNPDGFPNVIADSDDHVVDLIHPSMTLSVIGSPATAGRGETITYTFEIENTGDVALSRVSVIDTLLGDVTDSFPQDLQPAAAPVVVVLARTVQPDDPDPLVNTVTAAYEADEVSDPITRTASFSVNIVVPCALSPGFWKGGEGVPKWDDILSDYVAQNAGFDTDTIFPWLDGSLTGSTYLEVLDLPTQGDVTRQLSFKYIAARLNQAAFGLGQAYADLLDGIDAYFHEHPVGSQPQGDAKAEAVALLDAINAYFAEVGEGDCPPTSDF
jgi:uncharacterized repeat protein (TIGR01451 family)